MRVKDCLQRLWDRLANVLPVIAIVLACIAGYCWLDDMSYRFSRIVQVFVDKFYVEVVSIFFTVVVIDGFYRRQMKRQEERQRLIQWMASLRNDLALEAVRILRLEGWLTDGSLKRVYLRRANLADAELVNAYLAEAILNRAILEGADLNSAKLQGVKLKDAKLSGAVFLQANLGGADFTGATLTGASLQGAWLKDAIITVDQLREVSKTPDGLRGTTLPDGKLLPYKDDVSYGEVLKEFEAWCKEQEQK